MELLEDGRAREGHARRGCYCYVGRRHCYIGRRHRCDGVGVGAAVPTGVCLARLPGAGVSLLARTTAPGWRYCKMSCSQVRNRAQTQILTYFGDAAPHN